MIFFTRFILASTFTLLILLSHTVPSSALPQQLDALANRDVSQDGIEQITTIISATVTTTPSSSSTPRIQVAQETNGDGNGNRYPDPSNGLLGPCVVSKTDSMLIPFLGSLHH